MRPSRHILAGGPQGAAAIMTSDAILSSFTQMANPIANPTYQSSAFRASGPSSSSSSGVVPSRRFGSSSSSSGVVDLHGGRTFPLLGLSTFTMTYHALFHFYIERGAVPHSDLFHHPEAPTSTLTIVLDVATHVSPEPHFVADALRVALRRQRRTARCSPVEAEQLLRFQQLLDQLPALHEDRVLVGLWVRYCVRKQSVALVERYIDQFLTQAEAQQQQQQQSPLLSSVEPSTSIFSNQTAGARFGDLGVVSSAVVGENQLEHWFPPTLWQELLEAAAGGRWAVQPTTLTRLLQLSSPAALPLDGAAMLSSPHQSLERLDDQDPTLALLEVATTSLAVIASTPTLQQSIANAGAPHGSPDRGLSRSRAAWYVLDPNTAVGLMLKAAQHTAGSTVNANPLQNLMILMAYVRGQRRLHWASSPSPVDRATTTTVGAHSTMLSISPLPFLVFFRSVQDAKDVHADSVPLHSKLVLRPLQLLNRLCPTWYEAHPEESMDVVKSAIAVLSRGANPVLTLQIARSAVKRFILDGIDVSLFFLHRLSGQHHVEEARDTAQRLIHWLFFVAGIHLHSQYHPQMLSLARILMLRLGLTEEVSKLHSIVLDHVALFSVEFRQEWMALTADVVCPSCASFVPREDMYEEATCTTCMRTIPPKATEAVSSFSMTQEHFENSRRRKRRLREESRGKFNQFLQRARSTANGTTKGMKAPVEAATALKKALQSSSSSSHASGGASAMTAPLFVGEQSTAEGDAQQLFVLGKDASPMALRGAVEESARRLALQREARRSILAARGLVVGSDEAHSLTKLPHRSNNVQAASLFSPESSSGVSVQAAYARGALQNPTTINLDSDWVCVWCHQKNSAATSRVKCTACQAETGPEAPWRTLYGAASSTEINADLRNRILRAEDQPNDALVAAMGLLVYRRSFILVATRSDYQLVVRLMWTLLRQQQRVLCAYFYMRLLPLAVRLEEEQLTLELSRLFGNDAALQAQIDKEGPLVQQAQNGALEAWYRATSAQDHDQDDAPQQRDASTKASSSAAQAHQSVLERALFHLVFHAKQTCKVCFGAHLWQVCPIITRNFQTGLHAKIEVSREDVAKEMMARLLDAIRNAVDAAASVASSSSTPPAASSLPPMVFQAYNLFLRLPSREIFATLHPIAANQLSRLLSQCSEFVRAAFVCCNVPLALREDATYRSFTAFYGISEGDTTEALRNRSPIGTIDETHPNFSQVALTCCICLDQRHASFECPFFSSWKSEVLSVFQLQEEEQHATSGVARSRTNRSSSLANVENPQMIARLRAKVDGWLVSGPERRHAFFRFLLKNLEDLIKTRVTPTNPAHYALNLAITRLLQSDQIAQARLLYIRLPHSFVTVATSQEMLKVACGFSAETAKHMTENVPPQQHTGAAAQGRGASSSFHYRENVVSATKHCLVCAKEGHTFLRCPEFLGQASGSTHQKLVFLINSVGSIRCSTVGIVAAADYLYAEYNMANLTSEMLRAQPELVQAMVRLAYRCFAARDMLRGARTLRRVPIEMLEPQHYEAMWRASGMSEAAVEDRVTRLEALLTSAQLQPTAQTPQTRRDFDPLFIHNLSALFHEDQCRHCFEFGHTIRECQLFYEEASFGRDVVAVYRMAAMVPYFDNGQRLALYAHLARFLLKHKGQLPFHILGISSALNGLAASFVMDGEPGIGLRLLLAIPPAYRKVHVAHYVLSGFRVPKPRALELLQRVEFPGSFAPPVSSHRGEAIESGRQEATPTLQTDSLLMMRPPIPDILMEAVFQQVTGATQALAQSDRRLAEILVECVTNPALPLSLRDVQSPSLEEEGGPLQDGGRVSSSSSALKTAMTPAQRQQAQRAWAVDAPIKLRSAATANPPSPSAAAAAGQASQISSFRNSGGSSSSSQPRPTPGPSAEQRQLIQQLLQEASFIAPVQVATVPQLRESFEPLLSFLETFLGTKLGSRMLIFVNEIESLPNDEGASSEETTKKNETQTQTVVSHEKQVGTEKKRSHSTPRESGAGTASPPSSRPIEQNGPPQQQHRHRSHSQPQHHHHNHRHPTAPQPRPQQPQQSSPPRLSQPSQQQFGESRTVGNHQHPKQQQQQQHLQQQPPPQQQQKGAFVNHSDLRFPRKQQGSSADGRAFSQPLPHQRSSNRQEGPSAPSPATTTTPSTAATTPSHHPQQSSSSSFLLKRRNR